MEEDLFDFLERAWSVAERMCLAGDLDALPFQPGNPQQPEHIPFPNG